MKSGLRTAAIVSLALLLLSSRAWSYALEGQSWPDGSDIGFRFQFGELPYPLTDGSLSWTSATLPALAAWNTQMGSVSLSRALDVDAPPMSGDGVNSTFFSSTVFGDDFGEGVLAITLYFFRSGSIITEADIVFNDAFEFDSYRGPLKFPVNGGLAILDIRRVFIHELGHALGLDHPDAAGQQVEAIMNHETSDIELPTADDIAGIQFLYGAPNSSPTPTPTPDPTATPSPRLGNISTRVSVGKGDNVLIGGFIVQGDEPKEILIRGLGPSLTSQGVTGALVNPKVDLFDETGVSLAANNDWINGPDSDRIIETGIPPSAPTEAALIETLPAGTYTVTLEGDKGGTGVGLIEIYDLSTGDPSTLSNISTRGGVGIGDNVMIGGLFVLGEEPVRVLVRALGPSLPVDGALEDPILEMYNANGTLVRNNDDWKTSQKAVIIATGVPPTKDKESAIVTTLDPGAYTAIVRGANSTTGVGLVEVFALAEDAMTP